MFLWPATFKTRRLVGWLVVPPALKTYSSTWAFLAFPTASSDDDVREEAFDKDQVLFQATVHNQSSTD